MGKKSLLTTFLKDNDCQSVEQSDSTEKSELFGKLDQFQDESS